MENTLDKVREKIVEKGLKVTPQRMSILEAIYSLNNHPTADQIIDYIRKQHPNIATGTVYKVLDVLVQNKLIKKVKTEKDVMRYDGVLTNHHHLYCVQCDYIEDFENEKLDELLKTFFKQHTIENFIIDDIKLQINGSFIKHKTNKHK
jgi:Fur family peroxide stress response transcriptional regulator